VREKTKKNKIPIGLLKDLFAWWEKLKIQGMIIGGLAVSLLGRPRTTKDVDAVILLEEKLWKKFLALGKTFSFVPRIPKSLQFATIHKVFLLHHKKTAIDLDLSIGELPFEQTAIGHAQSLKVGKIIIKVPTVEDLIILKAVAHREKDLIDVQGLLQIHGKLDDRKMLRLVDDFANALEMPSIYLDFEKLVRAWRKKNKSSQK
jgi:predicted nucleotidyltransferase